MLIMSNFRIPKIPPTHSKSIRFPIDLIDEVENAIKGKESSFSQFVIKAVQFALDNLEETN